MLMYFDISGVFRSTFKRVEMSLDHHLNETQSSRSVSLVV